MRCPYCSHVDTQVVETRESDEGDVVLGQVIHDVAQRMPRRLDDARLQGAKLNNIALV